MDEIVLPTVRAMRAAGTPYSGVLYAGLMLTPERPKLIEYNCRFGDPECQVLMMRFDGDLLSLLLATAQGQLQQAGPISLSDRSALTIVMAAEGYPGTPSKGARITGIQAAEAGGALVFQAGTALNGADLIANGGRVLNITAAGASVAEARDTAYRAIEAIEFPGGFFRKDIGWRELSRMRND
jgi:phosphoribosylamine--glycine ligase